MGNANTRVDLTGKAFGRLSVEGEGEKLGYLRRWRCLCFCGQRRVVYQCHLTSGKSVSCGCAARGNARTHGCSATVENRIYRGIKSRCTNPNTRSYANYGGRGIAMCEGWTNDFMAFLADMGPRPSTAHSVDRRDNDGGYWCGHCGECVLSARPLNCRWVTHLTQARNKRGVVLSPMIAEEIRSLRASGHSVRGIARRGGLNRCTVQAVIAGRNWKVGSL